MSEAKGKGGNMALCTLRCFITTKLIVNRLNYCLCEEKKEKKRKRKRDTKKGVPLPCDIQIWYRITLR